MKKLVALMCVVLPLRAEAQWTFDAEAARIYDNNLSRAQHDSDIIRDRAVLHPLLDQFPQEMRFPGPHNSCSMESKKHEPIERSRAEALTPNLKFTMPNPRVIQIVKERRHHFFNTTTGASPTTREISTVSPGRSSRNSLAIST